jgi:hypothetical protein
MAGPLSPMFPEPAPSAAAEQALAEAEGLRLGAGGWRRRALAARRHAGQIERWSTRRDNSAALSRRSL